MKHQLKALFQVELIEHALADNSDFRDLVDSFKTNDNFKLQEQLDKLSELKFNEFTKKLTTTKWSLDYTQFSSGLYRYDHSKSE
jgi:hypothetical protein